MNRRFRRIILLSIAYFTLHSAPLFAQQSQQSSATDTSSPRSMLKGFVDSCNELHQLIKSGNYFDLNNPDHLTVEKRILDCIDVNKLPAFERRERAGEAAVCLKEIFDRHELPPWDEIPDIAAIEAAGGFEKLSLWRIPGTRITIERVEEGPQKHEYLFSVGTVDRAVEYFHDVEASPYRTEGPVTSPDFYKWYISTPHNSFVAEIVRRSPDRMRFGRTFGLTNWKWIGLFVALFIAVASMAIVYRWYLAIASRTRGRRMLIYSATIVFPVVAMMVPFLFESFVRDYLTIRGTPLYIVSFCANATATLAGVIIVFAACTRVAEAIIASPRVNQQGLNAQLIRIGSKLTSLALAVLVLLIGGQYLGIPVATLLASAGIGGLALALGAQDTLKTLFGTLMLMADKPFRVGERIIFKGYDGVVEDIGLRSTRLRLLTSHQVTIPNDELARSDIENVGRRQYIRRVTDFHIPLDTPSGKVEAAAEILRAQLDNHEGMNSDYPPRVYFVDILPTAFTIRVIYWYHPPNYWDYLAFGEKFNLAVFHAFEDEGIQFSLPRRVTHTSLNSEQAPFDVRMLDNSSGG